MSFHRRRTDALPELAASPIDPLDRARACCDALVERGKFQTAVALLVTDDPFAAPLMVGGSGRVDLVADMSRALADRVAREQRALIVVEPDGRRDDGVLSLRPLERHAAIALGKHRDGMIVLVVSDPALARREAESIAIWAADGVELKGYGGVCGPLAFDVAASYDVDVVTTAVFVEAAMLVTMHARSGALLRAWRVPPDTVWGEAARHCAAFVLGDLHRHPGATALSAVGMQHAAIVGLENGSGVALGAVGVAGREPLSMDVADRLIMDAPQLSAELVRVRTSPLAGVSSNDPSIELTALAARVHCERFAVYARTGAGLVLVSAHRADGSFTDPEPDLLEEQLICWAADQGGAVAIDHAAAVMVGGDTILYARDALLQPMTQLRNALISLRDDSDEQRAA